MAFHEYDEEEAALITKRIGLGFDFVRDVIDFPRLLELIPDKSRLAMRDLEIGQTCIRLVAYASPDRLDQWEARVTGPTWLAEEMNGDRASERSAEHGSGPASEEPGLAHGATEEAALDTLETRVRSSVSAEKLRASA